MNSQNKRKIGELFELCIELNKPDFRVFLHYSGHIDHVSILIYYNGFSEEFLFDEEVTFYVDEPDDEVLEAMHKAKFELIDIHNKFRSEK